MLEKAASMSLVLHFDQLRIGDRWKSPARTITESDISNFAGLTGDFDPLHMDHEYAKNTPFGKPIAHGLLGLAFVAGLSSQCPAVRTAAFVTIRNWEFLRPAFIGDTVHVVTEVVDLQAKGRRRGRVAWKRDLVNQRGETVQTGILETLVAVSTATEGKRKDSPSLLRSAPHTTAKSFPDEKVG